MLLHEVIRDGVNLDYRQEHGLPAAAMTAPDLLIHLDNKSFLCDVTIGAHLLDSVPSQCSAAPAWR